MSQAPQMIALKLWPELDTIMTSQLQLFDNDGWETVLLQNRSDTDIALSLSQAIGDNYILIKSQDVITFDMPHPFPRSVTYWYRPLSADDYHPDDRLVLWACGRNTE